MNQNIQDIKTQNLNKLFLKYLLPTVAGYLSTGILVFIDTVFIGRGIGTLGLASLNIAIPYFSIISLGLLLGVGGATASSIDAGRGDFQKKSKIFSLSLMLGIIFSILLSISISLFLTPFAKLLGAQGETLPMVESYIGIVSKFAAFYIIPHILNPFIRNDGNPNLSIISLGTCCFFNITLDYIFIFIFKWGMAGAALATGISQLISTLILLFHFKNPNNTLKFTFDCWSFKLLKRINSIGLASFINELCSGIVILAFNYYTFKFLGNPGVSAYSIMLNINILLYLIGYGISQGAQPLISINYGAHLHERVHYIMKLALKFQLGFGLLCYILFFIFRNELILSFDKDNMDVLRIASSAFPLYFLSSIIWGVNTQFSSFFQSIEKGKLSSITNTLRGLILILINLFLLPKFLGVNGIWLTPFVTEFATLALVIFFFKTLIQKLK
jgi:putative MATE family efflux protein